MLNDRVTGPGIAMTGGGAAIDVTGAAGTYVAMIRGLISTLLGVMICIIRANDGG